MDQHEAHAEAIRSNNLLLKGTYEDGYKAGFKAGREAGMREAAGIARKRDLVAGEGQMDAHGIYIAIISAIGGGK